MVEDESGGIHGEAKAQAESVVVVVVGYWAFNRVRAIRETMGSVGCVLPSLSSPSITETSAFTRTTASHSLLHPSSQNLRRQHEIKDFLQIWLF